MFEIRNNYHTHTYRCGHAIGTDEEYVLAAIEKGFKEIGFSDHIFLPNMNQEGMRGKYEELDGYLSSLKALREKYKDRIKIYIGFEAEWYKGCYKDYYESLLRDKGVDYLILGQHCTIIDNSLVWFSQFKYVDKALDCYRDYVIDGIRSGLFTYVCHPDYFFYFYPEWNEHTKDVSLQIIREAKKYHLPLEINMGYDGCHKNVYLESKSSHYPYPEFFELVRQENADCILGIDAHDPKRILTADYQKFYHFIENHRLNVLDKATLINPFRND